MKREIKQEWCENFILAIFKKMPDGYGIEVGYFWKMAENSGLWERGTYGTPMSAALGKLVDPKTKTDQNGEFLYDVFYLKEGAKA